MISFLIPFFRRIATDNISFLAGGVAFYGLLSIFPAIAALVSVYGLVADPHIVRVQLENAKDLFPPDVFKLIHDQVLILVDQPAATLGLTAVISIVLSISSATRGTKAILAALNTVFRLQESRGWWKRQVISYFLTIGAIVIMILALVIVIALPFILQFLSPDIAALIEGPLTYMRWMILGGAIWSGILLLFAIGPSREKKRELNFSALLIGATTATCIWVASAIGLSIFVTMVPNFQTAYGPLSAVIVLMLWVVLSAYAILIGAAVTATLDKSTAFNADARD